MKKSIISLFIGILGFGALATSCEDMLTPDMDRYGEFNGTDTVNFYVGILRNLQQVTEQNILLGELRGDLVKTTDYVTDSVSEIANFKIDPNGNLATGQSEDGDNALLNSAAYYKVINQCNFYLQRVDSLSIRNNHFFMRKETAQVLLIRAWTYMQLVQNYGKVPFITKPVSSSTTGWEKNPEAWATPDNLLSLLKSDMDQAWSYCETDGYPNYSNKSNFNTGLRAISHQLMLFDADVVYGDLYLLCGQSRADFEKAAEHYYNFLYKKNRTGVRINSNDAATVTPVKKDGTLLRYNVENSHWQGDPANVSYNFNGNEIVTGVPSAANSNFGLVLARIPNIYGFDIHSTNTTTSAENAEGETESSTTGYVSVTPNYRVRQVEPSEAYTTLNQSQLVICNNPDKKAVLSAGDMVEYTGEADARMYLSAPKVAVQNQGEMQFIAKFCGAGSVSNNGVARSFNFRYLIPIYRTRTLMLRYAEALNRAGFPEHAFAILRNGLNMTNYPMLAYDTVSIDTLNETITLRQCLDVNNNSVRERITYISDDELARASQKLWISGIRSSSSLNTYSHIGVHQAGCGELDYIIDRDTLYNYATQVYTRLAEEQSVNSRHFEVVGGDIDDSELSIASKRLAKRYVRHREEGEGGEPNGEDPQVDISTFNVVVETPAEPLEEEMLAMELILADEYALETAFEGNRYYDLMRIARHLNTFEGGDYGTDWLAWKIARRSQKLETPYENPTQLDGSLYNYLKVPANWYLQRPQ